MKAQDLQKRIEMALALFNLVVVRKTAGERPDQGLDLRCACDSTPILA